MDYDTEIKLAVDRLKAEQAAETRSDLGNTIVMSLIGGGLAYWAYGTVAHSCLFAFVIFSICAVANRIAAELQKTRASAAIREVRRCQEEG